MGSGLKNKKGNRMGDYMPTASQLEAQKWCITNEIRIWPTETKFKSGEWWAEIQINRGKIFRSPEAYGPGDIWKQIYEYFEFYYVKNRGNGSSPD